MSETWFEETLHPQYGQRFLVTRTLFRQKTDFQELAVHDTPAFGRVLTLDGVCQTTERDEFFYHEMMSHLPILAHGAAKRVLIVGGGDGGILEEVLKHRAIERATLVEIDPAVIEISRTYLPSISGRAFDDPRARVILGDGVKFVTETDETFDVIMVDSTDPIGPAEALFRTDFYAQCKRCLSPRGILVAQNGVPFLQAGAALQEASRGRLAGGSGSDLGANAAARCTILPPADRDECAMRMREGTTSGSAAQGGVLRELVRPVPAQPVK